MAIEYISSEFITQTNSTGNNSITVPADCDFVLLTTCRANSNSLTSASINGVSMSIGPRVDYYTLVNPEGCTAYMVSPPTGAQTLTTAFESSDDQASVICHYFKGVNQSSPVRSYATTAGSGTSIKETPSFDVLAGDLAIVFLVGYTNAIICDPSGKGQTEVYEWVANALKMQGLGTKSITSDGTTTMWAGGASYNAIIAMALEPLTATAIVAPPRLKTIMRTLLAQ